MYMLHFLYVDRLEECFSKLKDFSFSPIGPVNCDFFFKKVLRVGFCQLNIFKVLILMT